MPEGLNDTETVAQRRRCDSEREKSECDLAVGSMDGEEGDDECLSGHGSG